MTTSRTAFAVLAPVILVATVIGIALQLGGGRSGPESAGQPRTVALPDPAYTWGNAPSPVVLRLPGKDVSLEPWTSCWTGPPQPDGTASSICSDGAPGLGGSIPSVGSAGQVDFWFGMPGWRFEASRYDEDGHELATGAELRVERTSPQTFRVQPGGEPGTYRVDLFGRGEQGDVAVSFLWTIP